LHEDMKIATIWRPCLDKQRPPWSWIWKCKSTWGVLSEMTSINLWSVLRYNPFADLWARTLSLVSASSSALSAS